MADGDDKPFWETTPLGEMTKAQWESLCDGCAKCCLHKLEDADTGEIFFTDVACRLLDIGKCTCTRYAERNRLVPDCVILDACAYQTKTIGNTDLIFWPCTPLWTCCTQMTAGRITVRETARRDPQRGFDDLRRHRQLHQVQVHGLC